AVARSLARDHQVFVWDMPARPAPPAPAPSVTPTPGPSLSPVHSPRQRAARPPRRSTGGATSPLVFVLLITVPAVVAVAALRAR
ncbi:hypothetical protein AB0D72_12875, partial [Streptomyces sp. NPDC048188]